jgi:extradiol dioxygenase family protein
MENSLFGVIIKVRNLDICRSFYRDVLNLGEPTLDSNSWVEFKMPGNFILALEKVMKVDYARGSIQNVSWGYRIEDIEVIRTRLKEYGYHTNVDSSHRVGLDFFTCRDPEGNLFFLIPNSHRAKELDITKTPQIF